MRLEIVDLRDIHIQESTDLRTFTCTMFVCRNLRELNAYAAYIVIFIELQNKNRQILQTDEINSQI